MARDQGRPPRPLRERADEHTVDAVAQVTYLFSDIEGSTRRWDADPDRMSLDLTRQFDLIGVAVERHNGTVVQDTGDGVFAAFPNARDAVAAAVDAQRALREADWGEQGELLVRMGLHTGMADPGTRQYRGTSVNRCARVMDAAHGGQVLLSEATWAIVRDTPPPDVEFTDLGEHRLKDVGQPQRLFQVVADGLPGDFPPPRSRPDEIVACPYKGLAAFQAEDADRFFGRDELIDRLVTQLVSAPFLAVLGPSGSGKSSLVRAGLVPRLRGGGLPGSDTWVDLTLTPGGQPLAELARRLGRLTGMASERVAEQMSSGAPDAVVDQVLAGRAATSRLLVVVDQFEELFTVCEDEDERQRFIDVLLALVAPTDARAVVVVALRADFYGRCADHPDLARRLTGNQVLVGPMDRDELRAAVVGPARAVGLRVEDDLVEEIVDAAAGEAGGLPLVSHALVETWSRRDGDRLTLAGYTAAGGVEGAIARTADELYREGFDRLEQVVARKLLLRLVEPTESGRHDTRRPAGLGELRPADVPEHLADDVLDALVQARLVTVTEETAELAHEALIREWPTLRAWLDEDRDALRAQRHLTRAAQAWEELDRDDAELYRGARLAGALDLFESGQLSLSGAERAFLDASRERQEREEREAQRRTRRLQTLLVGTVIGMVAAAVAGVLAFQQSQEAQAQRATAETERARAEDAAITATSRELAAAAMANLDTDPELSILLAVQAIEVTRQHDGSVLAEAESALHHAVQASRVVGRFPGSTGVALSPGSDRVVVTSGDGPVYVYDVATQERLLELAGHDGRPLNVDVSDDGRLIASSGIEDGTVRLWDADTGDDVRVLDAGAPVLTPTFSPDGALVAAPAQDGLTRVWEVTTGEQVQAFEALGGLAFSPDGARLTVAAAEIGALSWDVRNGGEPTVYERFEALDVSYHPDGHLLATGHTDGFVMLWDATTGEEVRTIPVPGGGSVDNVTFDAQGGRLAVTGREGVIRILEASTGQQQLVLPAPGAQELHFTDDGSRLVAGTTTGAALMWDVTPTGSRDLAAFPLTGPFATDVAFTADGSAVAATRAVFGPTLSGSVNTFALGDSDDASRRLDVDDGVPAVVYTTPDGDLHVAVSESSGGTRLLDVGSGEQVAILSGYDLAMVEAAPSPDGRLLATAGFDPSGDVAFDPSAVHVWDTATGEQVAVLTAHEQDVLSIAFDADGDRLVSGSQDETAIVWDTSTWEPMATLEGHAENVEDVVFTPDGSQVITASNDATIGRWDARTGERLATLTGHTAAVLFVAFRPDGRLVSGSSDGTVRLWDLERDVTITELPVPRGGSVALSTDGSRIATLDFIDAVVHVVTLDIDELLDVARQRVTRSLTQSECDRYLEDLFAVTDRAPQPGCPTT